MHAPVRLLYGLRPKAPLGLLAAALAASLMFAASPLAIPDVADRFEISLGIAGLISTAQVGGFGLANLLGGRLLTPSVSLLSMALGILLAMDTASALSPSFALLVVFRVAAGIGAGLITWVAWADSAHERRRLADVAAVGPVGAIIGAPILGLLVEAGGFRLAYAVLGSVAAMALIVPKRLAMTTERKAGRVSASRSNLVLLAALLMLTLAGSSIYVYSARIADDHFGLGPLAVSFAFSLNAAGGVAATRVQLARTPTGMWFVVTALAVFAVGTDVHPSIFYGAMATWGFAFWIMVPRVLRMLAERSLSPDERIGDAQAGMAFGRALGPLVGAPLASAGVYVAMGSVAAAGLLLAGMMVVGVKVYRIGHREPTVPSRVWQL